MRSLGNSLRPDRLARLSRYLQLDGSNAELRKDAIHEAIGSAQWEIALHFIDGGLRSKPPGKELSSFLLLRARCLHHMGRRADAIADCRLALASMPDDADTNGLMALLLQEQGCGAEACGAIEAALRADPRQPDALLAQGLIQSDAQDFDAAQRSFDTLLSSHPTSGRAWSGVGMAQLAHMQLDAAEHAFEQATTHMPEHIGSWHMLAWLRILRRDVDAAARAFERALTLDRTFGETHGGLAVTDALQGRDADARAGIRRALRLDPQAMSARYAELILLRRAGRHDEATALLDAFLARPALHSDMQYRDLVLRRLDSLSPREPALANESTGP